MAALVIFTLIGSCYDIKMRNKNQGQSPTGNKYLLCFSVFQNIRHLIPRQPEDPKLQQLTPLHGIRTLALVCTTYAHFALLMPVFNKDPETLEKAYDGHIFYYLFFNGMMVVQIFFFLSGFLLAYLLQMNSEKIHVGWSLVPKALLLRWSRLTPVCAMMVAFIATWMRHLGSGPLWKLATTTGPTAACRTYWCSHLLYVNNLVPDNKLCMFQTWHIAADMQMFILGVVVHVATRNGKRALTISLLLILGMLAPAIHVWLYGTRPTCLLTAQFLRTMSDETYYYLHNRGYMNLPCFLLGMSSGYIGLNLQRKGVDLSKNRVLRFLSWWVIPLIMAVMLAGRMFASYEVQVSIWTRMAYAATHRAALGLLLSAFVLGIICRCNDLSRMLLEWPFWMVTSKLSYCVYIVHIAFLYLFLGNRQELFPVSFINVGYITFGGMVLSYIVAVPMYLMIEAPFGKLIQVITEDREARNKTD
ncbi:nose resistant to fluoxetine protein 6-like [Epargyreus clarus]|uniref:nose resistant to fluoxetine protein 6-like n=1 Tax=Epargyreus clarus TaxID=520877 RepID=UPI003C307691